MKRAKKLTRNMKEALSRAGYDPKECHFIEEDREAWRFWTTYTDEQDNEYKESFWLTKPY